MNIKEHLLNRITDGFEELNISQDIIDELDEYLNDEIDEREFLDKLPRIDFSKVNKRGKLIQAINSIRRHNDKEYLRKYINALYEIGRESANIIVRSNYYSFSFKEVNEYINIGIEKFKVYSMYLEANAYDLNYLYTHVLYNIYKLCKNEPEEAKKVIKNLKCNTIIYDNANTVISSIYCALVDFNNLKALKNDVNTYNFCRSTLSHIEESMLDSIDNMYENKLPEDFIKRIKDFIKSDKSFEDGEVKLILKAIKSYEPSNYLFRFLLGLAYLNSNNSKILDKLVKFFAKVDPKMALDSIFNIFNNMQEELKKDINGKGVGGGLYDLGIVYNLDKILDVEEKYYVLWCAEKFENQNKDKGRKLLEKKFEKNSKAFEEASKICDPSMSNYLMSFFLNGEDRSKYYDSIKENCINFVLKNNKLLDSRTISNKEELIIREFLEGKKSFEECEKTFYSIPKSSNYYYFNVQSFNKNIKLLKKCNMKDLYDRILLLVASVEESYYLWAMAVYDIYHRDDNSINEVTEMINYMFNIFNENNLPLEKQMTIIDNMLSNYGHENVKKFAIQGIINKMIANNKKEFAEKIKTVSVDGRVRFLESIFKAKNEENAKILISYFCDSSKVVKEKLVSLFEDEIEFYPLIKEKLLSKKQGEREVGIRILDSFKNSKECDEETKTLITEELNTALEKEKSQKIRELLMKSLNIENKNNETLSDESFIKSILKGNRKSSLAWLEVGKLSSVKMKDSEEYATEDYLNALLLCYSSIGTIAISQDGNKLAKKLDKNDLALFANEVFDKWFELGAEAKKRWVLAFSAIYGGNTIVPKLNTNISEWAKNSRGAIASEAVRALALNGSATALLIVDGISRKFKFKQVKTAAGEALNFAAEQMGMDREELSDKIVPSLGFDKNGERIFDYGTRKFKVILTPSLEIEVYDEKDKKLKNLPAPGKRDDEKIAKESHAEFKAFKKQLKTTISVQATRLDLALSSERKWSKEAWTELFVNNPLMHEFAIGLIWGAYEDGKLQETFRYMEDGTFNTKDEDEFEMPENCKVALIHPLELTKEDLDEWKEQLENYEITQPIEQLNRKVFTLTEEEEHMKSCERFGGKVINGLSLSGKIMAQGWYRGSIQDAGGYFQFYKEDNSLKIGAELSFEGLSVGYENEDTTIHLLKFYKAGTVERGSYVYDEIKDKDIIPLKNVPKKFFSEILYQVDKALSSSTDFKENWKSDL